jgi:hypothetical protein
LGNLLEGARRNRYREGPNLQGHIFRQLRCDGAEVRRALLYKAKQTPEMLAEEIRERDLQHAGRMITGFCDTSAFANVGLGMSRAAVMNRQRQTNAITWRAAPKGRSQGTLLS